MRRKAFKKLRQGDSMRARNTIQKHASGDSTALTEPPERANA
jgi:hypothetical protein